MRKILASAVLLLTIISICSCSKVQDNSKASPAISSENTILVVNADIVTMHSQKPSANAMAITGDRIVATVRGGMITYSDVPEYDRVDPPGGE